MQSHTDQPSQNHTDQLSYNNKKSSVHNFRPKHVAASKKWCDKFVGKARWKQHT